ncbi:MAG: homoserine O-succinyltransferase [Gammaproteobacteria bacterium]|nr:homoserine O-succinyltransferase [Gammaproteobacteria bacterium]
MPLVAHTNLPTFQRLRDEGETILPRDYALQQEIRELHIGLLNMMPDAALEATERQFFRLIGESNQIAQFYLHPFSLDELPRGPQGRAHVERYYESFATIQKQGLDALIITGVNPTHPELSQEPFWRPLIKVVNWAYEHVTSTLCSCLATHAVMEFRYQQKRQHQGFKRWGVYSHRVVEPVHPLVSGVNTRFDVPHSRFYNISRAQFEAAGLHILVESGEAGVHLAVSEDQFRIIFFQGHPEYDTVSLLKEYKREIKRFLKAERADYPPFVDNYFSSQLQAILDEYREQVINAKQRSHIPPEFPEHLIIPKLDNTWHDSAEAVINSWIGKVYQLTDIDRKKPFQAGIDPQDPLGLKR